MKDSTPKALQGFENLYKILQKLRSPDGCPWDRKQTEKSMAPLILEEAYEVVDAIEGGDSEKVAEELGDLCMNLFMTCLIAEEKGLFDASSVFSAISAKLVNRHPHVFDDHGPMEEEHFLHLWEKIKREERKSRNQDTSAVAGIPAALPALQRALRLLDKMKRAGIPMPVLEPSEQQCRRLFEDLISMQDIDDATIRDKAAGSLLVDIVLFCVERKINPEMALRAELTDLENKFRELEKRRDNSLE